MFSLYRLIQYYIERKKERNPGVFAGYAIGYWFGIIVAVPMYYLAGFLFVYFFWDLPKEVRNYAALSTFFIVFFGSMGVGYLLEKKVKYDRNINVKQEAVKAFVFLLIYYLIIVATSWWLFKYGNW
jgi:hypothetical protein